METLTAKFLKAFVKTSPLWLEVQFSIEQFKFPEIDYAAVPDSHVPANMRLGHKMEHLFKNCLQGQTVYELLAHNIAVKRDNKTIGEIDFLLKDKRDRSVLHVELTYKFYLIDTSLGDPVYQLIGPNRKDKCYSKLEKLKNNQFTLPFSREGKEQLALLNVTLEDITQEVCFKAQLFAPYQHSEVNIRPFNNHCISGFWIHYEALTASKFHSYEYYLPSKDEWIISPYDKGIWISYDELLLELEIHMFKKRSPLVWLKEKESVFKKFFVVWW